MVSMEVVGPELLFVEGGMMRNKYCGGIIKFSEGKRLVDLFIDNSPVIK